MPLDATLSNQPCISAMRRIGTLMVRSWRAKLYAPALAAGRLRPEHLAAMQRAYHGGIAGPVAATTAGFALLRPCFEGGDLMLSAYWWEGTDLHRSILLLPGSGGPPQRRPDAAERVGAVAEVLLIAREAMAWSRCVLAADVPSPHAYLAECCA